MTESELALAEQKCNDYSVIVNRLKQELSDSSTVHQSDIRREREVLHPYLTFSFVFCFNELFWFGKQYFLLWTCPKLLLFGKSLTLNDGFSIKSLYSLS